MPLGTKETTEDLQTQRKTNFSVSFSSCSIHSTRCGDRKHPPHCQPLTGHSVWSPGLLLPGPSSAHHLRESSLICPGYQGSYIRLGRACFTWSCKHGVRLRHKKNILRDLQLALDILGHSSSFIFFICETY